MRVLRAWDAGVESAIDGYRADQLMAAAVAADPETALLRIWNRPYPSLSVGRYHRIAEGKHADMQRRLSGGRVVPVGPDVLGLTLAVSSSDWLGGSVRLRPDQVLNRALRPLLSVLRDSGIDAFYGGRDLVSVGGRPIVHAAFCPFADGVLLAEQFVAVGSSFACLETLAAAIDPEGLTVTAPGAFSAAAAVADFGAPPPRGAWLAELAARVPPAFSVRAHALAGPPDDLASAVVADGETYAAFARERGAAPRNAVSAAAVGMMGMVEAAAVIEDLRVCDLEITGDVIAPFETLEALSLACAGRRAEREVLRRVVSRELAAPGRFVLGLLDLEELLARLV